MDNEAPWVSHQHDRFRAVLLGPELNAEDRQIILRRLAQMERDLATADDVEAVLAINDVYPRAPEVDRSMPQDVFYKILAIPDVALIEFTADCSRRQVLYLSLTLEF